MKYKIGVDIGTTSTKVVLYDENLEVRGSSNVGYRTICEQPGYAEQDPDEILLAFNKAINQVIDLVEPENIEVISFSSAMHSLILLDRNYEPLTKSIIWSDNRSVEEVDEFKLKEDWLNFYQRTGTPIHPMSPFFKILWFKKNTDLIEKTAKIIGIKEYIIYKMTGQFMIDYSIASATGLFNIHSLSWDEEALDYLALDERKLSTLTDVTTRIKTIQNKVTKSLKLSMDTEILIGASDGCLANLGASATDEGETTFTIGTSAAVRMTVNKPLLDEKGRTFCYYLSKDKWVIGGAVNNGGNLLHWLENILYMEEHEIFKKISESVLDYPIGSEGLIFLPYLNGERSPHWDGSLRASFLGLSAYHKKEHLIRAVLEGMLCNLREVWGILENLSGKSSKIVINGGFFKNPILSQMLADLIGKDSVILEDEQSSCLGAVRLDDESINHYNTKVHLTLFHKESHEEYTTLYNRYLWFSHKLKDINDEFKKQIF